MRKLSDKLAEFNQDILEEVVYTICLSINDSIDIDSVVFMANDKEMLRKNISDLK